MEFGYQYHLGLSPDQVQGCRIALLPGDPERVPKIAKHLEDAQQISYHREFQTYRGRLGDLKILVTSTGIGGPSTSICVEELAQLGVRTLIRVGTTGAIQPEIEVGSVIVSQAAVRWDGASYHFAPPAFPATADFDATLALRESARKLGISSHVGVTVSSDTFYPGQERKNTFSGYIPLHLRGTLEEWQKLGVLNYEMEAATLFVMGQALRLRTACVSGVLVNRTQTETPERDAARRAEASAIQVAIGALPFL